MKKRNAGRLLCFMFAVVIAFILIPMNLQTVYAGTIDLSTLSIFKNHYGAGATYDVQRDPVYPAAGTKQTLSGFKSGYNDNRTHQTLSNGDYLQFSFVESTGSNALLDDINNTGKKYAISLGLYSQNGTLKKVIAEAGGVVFYGPSTEAGVIFCELNNYAGLLLTDKYYSYSDVLTYTPSIGPVTKLSELATYNAGSASDPKHVHGDWTYVLKDGTTDTIEALCGVRDPACDLTSNPVVTLHAANAVYTGMSYANENMVDKITSVVGNGVVRKKYYSVDEDGYETSLTGAPTGVGSYKAEVIVGSESNSVTVEDSFVISPKSIEGADDIDVVLDQDSYEYDGSTKEPSITVKDITRNVWLTENTDYEISGTISGSSLSGENGYTITVTGIGNYEGSVNKTWRITKKIPAITIPPTVEPITYGARLETVALVGGRASKGGTPVEGSFEWKNPTIKPTVADSDTTEYEVVFQPENTEDYESVTCKVRLTVLPKTVELLWKNTALTYNGKEQAPIAMVKNLDPEDQGKVTVVVTGKRRNANTSDELNNPTGGYTVTAEGLAGTAATNYNFAAVSESDKQKKFKIYPKKITEAMVKANRANTNIAPVISVEDIVYGEDNTAETKVLEKDMDYTLDGDLSTSEVGAHEVAVSGKGNYIGYVQISYKITDSSAPTGTIKVSEHQWQELANPLSFDIFYKKKQNVMITAADEGSGVDKVYYFLTSSALSLERSTLAALPENKWTPISNGGSFIINPDNRYVIYAKITDISGNVTFVSSNGIVLDKSAPVITGIENNKTYCSGVSFKVSDVIELASVEIDGVDKGTAGRYTIDATTEDTTHTIVAVDKTGNSTSYTITIRAGGMHDFGEDWTIIKEATCNEDGVKSHSCACGAVETEIISKLNHDYATEAGDAHFVWTADKGADGVVNGYNATAYFVCKHDSRHIVDADSCVVVREITTPATVGAEGEVTYTATATRGGITYTAKKKTTLAKLTTLEDNQTGSNIYTSTSVAPDAPKTTSGKELDASLAKKLMTPAETADYLDVAIATDVTVYLEVQNINGTVAQEETRQVEEQIADLVTKAVNTDLDVVVVSGAAYVDLAMYKNVTTKVGETVTSDTTTQITDTGAEITITMDVPRDIPPVTSGFTRKYSVIRVHNGTAEVLSTDQIGNQLTFKTSKFSTYAVFYVDVKDTSVTPPSEYGGGTVITPQPDDPKKEEQEEDKEEQEKEDSENGSSTAATVDTTYCKMRLAEAKATRNTVKLSWKQDSDADGYVIYGALCNSKGKVYKLKAIADIRDGSKTAYTNKNLKSGTYYKYRIKAYKLVNGKKVWLARSKMIHVTTNGGKYGNAKSVKVNKTGVTLTEGKTFAIEASQVVGSKPIQKHTEIKYESANSKVASVNSKGVIKAKSKGTCYIYVYAQNGMYKRIKVTVK